MNERHQLKGVPATTAVDQSVIVDQSLADIVTGIFRDDAARQWKLSNQVNNLKDALGKEGSISRGITANIVADLLQILRDLQRPSYLSRRLSLCLTSSVDRLSPASS